MPGTFSEVTRPTLAGSYFDFVAVPPPVVPQAAGRIVTVLFTHSWGPLKTVTPLNSFADFLATFRGDPASPSSGYVAVKEAFQGSGQPGEGGAGQVLAYRMGGSAAAKATKTLQNTAGTPANALTLSAKYEGADGNNLRVTTQDHAANVAQDELLILDQNGTVLETYVYNNTDVAGLRDQINLVSKYATAAMLVDGVALGYVTSSAFTGGNSGATLIAGDYTTALAALETQRFGVLAFENLTDSSIQAAVKAWVQGQNAAGRRFSTVLGGALDESIGTAITRSAAMNDPDIVNIGVGRVVDHEILDAAGNPLVLSTAQLSPRIAGVLANRGERMSMTFTKLSGIDLVNGAAATDIVKAYDNGVIVLSRASDALATVRVEKALTTFTTTTDSSRPKAVFSNPKFVATMHGLQDDLTLWADDNIIGSTTVDDETRNAVLAQINSLLRQRQELGSVRPGWSAYVDPTPPPSDDDAFVAFVIAAKFGRSVEQVFFTGQLG